MSLARKISWWSLLAMVFVVPVAMSNLTWLNGLGFQVSLPITYDQFDILKVFFQRVLTLVALGAWSWDMLTKGGKIRRTPVDWLILAFLVWVTITTFTSIHPPTAFFGKYRRFEGLLSFINYAVIYFLVLQFADRPSRVRALARSLFWSSIVVAGYGVLQRLGARPRPVGAAAVRAVPPLLDVRQPRPARRVPDVLAAGVAGPGVDLREAVAATWLLGRLRHERVRLHRGVHARRLARRHLWDRDHGRHRLAALGEDDLGRLAADRRDRHFWAARRSSEASRTPPRS